MRQFMILFLLLWSCSVWAQNWNRIQTRLSGCPREATAQWAWVLEEATKEGLVQEKTPEDMLCFSKPEETAVTTLVQLGEESCATLTAALETLSQKKSKAVFYFLKGPIDLSQKIKTGNWVVSLTESNSKSKPVLVVPPLARPLASGLPAQLTSPVEEGHSWFWIDGTKTGIFPIEFRISDLKRDLPLYWNLEARLQKDADHSASLLELKKSWKTSLGRLRGVWDKSKLDSLEKAVLAENKVWTRDVRLELQKGLLELRTVGGTPRLEWSMAPEASDRENLISLYDFVRRGNWPASEKVISKLSIYSNPQIRELFQGGKKNIVPLLSLLDSELAKVEKLMKDKGGEWEILLKRVLEADKNAT